MEQILDFLGLLLFLAGFIIGLGAVVVIDIHGFLGRKSGYWTRATISAHKVTKPLIWLGIFLAIIGGAIFYKNQSFSGIVLIHSLIALVLILNGLFLSFKVSPFLLKQEKSGREKKLLPASWQRKIMLSFVISFLGWWSALGLLTYFLLN